MAGCGCGCGCGCGSRVSTTLVLALVLVRFLVFIVYCIVYISKSSCIAKNIVFYYISLYISYSLG